jgi:methenyltetrahydromethanopterin cyclohydrolase
MGLNEAGYAIAEQIAARCATLGAATERRGGVLVVDCGVRAAGSNEAGLAMARAALGGAGVVSLRHPGPRAATPAAGAAEPVEADTEAWPGCPWPTVAVASDQPVAACLAAQYAGWKVARDDYFAMASGPIRAAIGREPVFDTIGLREAAPVAVGLLESGRLPPAEVCQDLARAAGVAPEQVCLLVARTASPAGTLQVVARSLETALHKLHDLGFDLGRIRRGSGTAPLPPLAADDLTAIGRTNDAILYGGSVALEVTGDDASLAEIGPRTVSRGSPAFGAPFLAIFEAAGRDFYAIDPALFAPARLELVNVETGRRHSFGGIEPDLIASSFSSSGDRSPAGR